MTHACITSFVLRLHHTWTRGSTMGTQTVEATANGRVPCRGRQTANTLESNKRCGKAETECEDSLEKEQLVRLPSTGRFEDRFSHCQAAFDRVCIGPAHAGQVCHQASSLPISCAAYQACLVSKVKLESTLCLLCSSIASNGIFLI